MATNGYRTVTVTSYDSLRFSWEEESQSIANNTTTISWKLQLISSDYGRIDSTAKKDWSVTVNGKTYSGQNTVGIGNNTTKTLASGTTTISHNSDGTKTFSYSFSQEFAINFNGYVGTKSGSGTGTLNTIPRKSTMSVASGTLGKSQTLTVTRKSTSFTHTITAKCGSASTTICTKSSNTSITFTPPIEWAKQNTTGTSVSVTYTITTYNGSTSVGSNSYTVSCSIPSSVVPTVSFTVADNAGYMEWYGGFIQGKSSFNIAVTASGSQGSTIKSYKTTADGKTYTTASISSSMISGSGQMTITVVVTDSRGRTATASKTVTVFAYEAPKITSFKAQRCDEEGNATSTGTHLKITFNSTVSSVNSKNGCSYVLQTKKVSDTQYEEVELSAYTGNLAVTGGTYVFPADTGSSYNLILRVADNFGVAQKTAIGASVKKLWSWLKGNKGLAFGKVAELEDYCDMDYIGLFRKGVELSNNMALRGVKVDGTIRPIVFLNTNDNLQFGYGSYSNKEGIVYYDGHKVNIRANDTITSNKTITVSSDRRLKENIVRFDDVAMFSTDESDIYTQLFDKLQPVSFNYIDGNGKICFGFIAQDVIEALNELGIDENEVDLVSEVKLDDEAETTYGIGYGNLHALQIHKIKKLEKRIEELEALVDKLLPI